MQLVGRPPFHPSQALTYCVNLLFPTLASISPFILLLLEVSCIVSLSISPYYTCQTMILLWRIWGKKSPQMKATCPLSMNSFSFTVIGPLFCSITLTFSQCFLVYLELCNHHHSLILHFHHLKKKFPVPIQSPFPPFPSALDSH